MSSGVVIVTGASQGLGRAISVALAKLYGATKPQRTFTFYLLARNREGLRQTAAEVTKDRHNIRAVEVPIDLGDVNSLEGHLKDLFSQMPENLEQALLINNAGSLGPLEKTIDQLGAAEIRAYLDFNLVSTFALTAKFLELFRKKKATEGVVVNISSLLAVQAFSHWGLYGAGKAARDSLHTSITKEFGPNVRTLNYAPGPLEGEMQKVVRETIGDVEQRTLYSQLHADQKLVGLDESAAKLVRLLSENSFVSGSHIDFYDV